MKKNNPTPIPIAEYARIHGRTAATIRQKILAGNLKATKMGRDWFIDPDEPYVDLRYKNEGGKQK